MVFTIIAVVVMIDFIGFFAWAFSGQVAPDNFYVGSLTAHVIKATI